MRSPAFRIDVTSAASLAVARSFGSTIEKLEAGETASIEAFRRCLLLRRRLLPQVLDRENAGDGGSTADGRIELDRTTMQLDEGTHDRQTKPGAAVLGT